MFISRSPVDRDASVRVLIVDDHPLYGDALASALEVSVEACIIQSTQTLAGTFEALDAGFQPDLIVFDLKLPDVSGISGFHALKARESDARILVVSSLASSELVQSLIDAGADGFLPKDASGDVLTKVVHKILKGQRHVPSEFAPRSDGDDPEIAAYRANPELSALTAQQMRILKLICAGKANKQIAYELSLAEATVKAHITALLRRLGVQNRTQAVVVAETALMLHGASTPEARAFLQH